MFSQRERERERDLDALPSDWDFCRYFLNINYLQVPYTAIFQVFYVCAFRTEKNYT